MSVSIIVLNFNHPELIDICLHQLMITEGIDYEIVVVDNGTDGQEQLEALLAKGLMTRLVSPNRNTFFSEGNNIGVFHSNPDTDFVLLLNSDVAVLRPDWLSKMVAWAEGTIETKPAIWSFKPTQPKGGKLDIVSMGWSYDGTISPSHVHPEGHCCLFRRSAWRDLDESFPFHGGFDKTVSEIIRDGGRCGVLSQDFSYIHHKRNGSGFNRISEYRFLNSERPDPELWYDGLEIETLDFTLGEDESESYLTW